MRIWKEADGTIMGEAEDAKFCNEMKDSCNQEIMQEINNMLVNKKLTNMQVMANLAYLLADTIADGAGVSDEMVCLLSKKVEEYLHISSHMIHADNTLKKKHH